MWQKLTRWDPEGVCKHQSQWCVITGPPCCGKSTTVELLARHGFRVRPEIARDYIDQEISKGRTIQEIRSDAQAFQCEVLRRALIHDKALPEEEFIFFDRGIPDSIAYLMLHGIDMTSDIEGLVEIPSYRRVFILDPLQNYEVDYARMETPEERDRIFQLLWEVYGNLKLPVERVPALSREERIKFILMRATG